MTDTTALKKTKDSADERDTIIGARLRARRNLMKMSQSELAESVNLTFQQIQKYEHGRNRLSIGRLLDFSRILKVPATYFLAGLGDIGETTPRHMAVSDNPQETLADDPMIRKETTKLVAAYYAIKDEKQRRYILNLIESMAEAEKNNQKNKDD